MTKLSIYFSYIVLTSCFLSASVVADTGPAKTQKAIDAEALYTQNCAICHGDRGDGNTRTQSGLRPPPRNFTTIDAALELSRERMIKSVTEGRPGTAMMPHKDRLSTEEIAALVDYIRTNFMRTPDVAVQPTQNRAGAEIYSRYCGVCHGDKGNTAVWARNGLNPPPRDFTTAEARRLLTRDRMIHSVTNGRPGTGMMPFTSKLNAKEIEAVVDYIRQAFLKVDAAPSAATASQAPAPATLPHGQYTPAPSASRMDEVHAAMRNRQDPHAGPHQGGMPALPSATMPIVDADMSLPLPNNLKGNAVKGQQFFMGNCFTCHGVTGQGDGPRAYFNIPRPRNFTSEESRRVLNRVRLYTAITDGKVGTVMPAWGKVLSEQQVADVAEFVFQAFIRPQDYPEISGFQIEKKKAP
ncbi:c-type cytochrome [Kaarinaea lacus]